MSEIRVKASALVPAPPPVVYGILADYRAGHPGILPPEYFRDFTVEQGGRGAGTVIRFRMVGMGPSRPTRGRVEEPEPGRVLTECYDETGAVTTFTVDPEGAGSRVTFTTVWSAPGLRGVVERALAPPFLRRVYAKELANLARAAARAAGG